MEGRKGGRKGASDRRQASGTGGWLPDGRLMERRADFIFRGSSSRTCSSSLSLVLSLFYSLFLSARAFAAFVLTTGCRNTAREMPSTGVLSTCRLHCESMDFRVLLIPRGREDGRSRSVFSVNKIEPDGSISYESR